MMPHVLAAAWVVFLAVTIWHHAHVSVQPPGGDGLSYLQKAASFWAAVDQGDLFNPLNLQPSIRPPGTVLMSYPFGLTADFHGYHFRSVFLPLLCVVIAVYVAAGMDRIRRNAWLVAGLAFLLSSLPMFYWLDFNDDRWINNGWGMVDNFQAGVAALAAACLVRTLYTRSQAWLVAAALLACFTFLVKQSGLMLMGLVGLVWLVALAFEWRLARQEARPPRRYMVGGMVRFAVVYGGTLALALFSAYLSRANFAYAMKALGFYRDIAPDVSLSLFHSASGEVAVAWMLVAAGLFAYHLRASMREDRRAASLALGLATGTLIIWVLGLWYWIVVQAGGRQIRYFYPFMLMGAICSIPALLTAWPRAAAWIRGALLAVCFGSAANIGLLLMAGDSPSPAWQEATGVSVSVGHHRDEVERARRLLARVRDTGRDARVYFTPTVGNSALQTFLFVGAYEKLLNPNLPAFEPVSPMDWTRGFAVRTNDLVDSDYILTRKFASGAAGTHFSARELPTYEAESAAFDAWLSTLDKPAGVETWFDGERIRVLRVADRDLFAAAVRSFVSEHSWRPEFLAANRPGPPAWSDARAVAEELRSPAAGPVAFEDVYVVHAIRALEADNGVRVDVWWEERKHEDANDRRYLFLHLVDAEGTILQSQQLPLFPYAPPSPDKRWRHGTATFHDVLPNASIRYLAFGIYEPLRREGGLLSSSGSLRTDWGGKRNLIATTRTETTAKVRLQ